MNTKTNSSDEKSILEISDEPVVISLDGLKLDVPNRWVVSKTGILPLTQLQARLLCILMMNAQQIVSRERLAAYIWETDYTHDTRALDGHIRKLKGKLINNPVWKIETVRGLGFRLTRKYI